MTVSGEGWDGRGLPPAAAARLERARRSGVTSSLLAVDSQAGLDSAGLAPVGEVMGCLVQHIGWQGYAGCGWYGGFGGALGTPFQVTTQVATPGAGLSFSPYVDALDGGWRGAIGRMLEECRELGGDGVVGVRLEERHLDQGNREFSALGTAVRSLGPTHTRRPFATTLAGQEVAKLLQARWVPAGILVCLALGIRHDDYRTRQATFWSAGNVEVPGYSELVGNVREGCRQLLRRRCAEAGAEGAVLTSPMSLSIHELEIAEGHTDHAAIASLVATTIAYFGRPGAGGPPPHPHPLVILPLDR